MKPSLLKAALFLALPTALLGRGDFDQRLHRAMGKGARGLAGQRAVAKAGQAAELAKDPWQRLMQGNARHVNGQALHPNSDEGRRRQVAQAQQPFAMVLACADSRVPPELVFDQGLGDLFVVRVAGNVADSYARASLEYAVEHLHSPLLVVLGHERCGAVKASHEVVLDPKAAAGLSPDLKALVQEIEPAVKGRSGDKALDLGVRANASRAAQRLLEQSGVLRHAVEAGRLKVVAARYDLDSGQVERMD